MTAYTGLVLIVIMWLAGWYLLTKWHEPDMQSISRHAASSPLTMGLFAVVLILCGALLYGWMLFWLAPEIGLGVSFTLLVATAFVCQAVAAAVPDLPGWKRPVHKIAAWTMAWLFLPLGWFIALAPGLSPVARALCLVFVCYMTCSVGLFVSRAAWARRRFLFFQASYIVALQMLVLVAAYL